MALHPLKLPRQAALLYRVVALHKRLLKALADPALVAGTVDTTWVKNVWSELGSEWVRKFCERKHDKRTQEARIQVIAAATAAARGALYDEFCRQNRVRTLFAAGEDFRDLCALPDVDAELAKAVREYFKVGYARFSHSTQDKWPGYALPGQRTLCNRDYKDAFCSKSPTSVVCPYCDGEIGTQKLDHYLSKKDFPLLACSPRNLVPVCNSCNEIAAKADRPAITEGNPRSMDDWLHPFFRPASPSVCIELSGTPKDAIPRLHSTDLAEQVRLDNHTNLIQTLSKRWTNQASSYHDELVGKVKRRRNGHPARSIDDIVCEQLKDHLAVRGRSPSTMIKAAVCQAVLDRRAEYLEEFDDSNAVALD